MLENLKIIFCAALLGFAAQEALAQEGIDMIITKYLLQFVRNILKYYKSFINSSHNSILADAAADAAAEKTAEIAAAAGAIGAASAALNETCKYFHIFKPAFEIRTRKVSQ